MSEVILEEKEPIPSNEYLLEELAKIREVLKQLKNLNSKTVRSAKPKARRNPVKRRAVVKRKASAKRKPVKRRDVVKRKASAKRKPVKRRAVVKRKASRRRK